MSSQHSEELARNLAVADLEGLFEKHTHAWDMFHDIIKVYGAVACLPLVVMATLITAGKYDVAVTPTITLLPLAVAGSFLVAGCLGFVVPAS